MYFSVYASIDALPMAGYIFVNINKGNTNLMPWDPLGIVAMYDDSLNIQEVHIYMKQQMNYQCSTGLHSKIL